MKAPKSLKSMKATKPAKAMKAARVVKKSVVKKAQPMKANNAPKKMVSTKTSKPVTPKPVKVSSTFHQEQSAILSETIPCPSSDHMFTKSPATIRDMFGQLHTNANILKNTSIGHNVGVQFGKNYGLIDMTTDYTGADMAALGAAMAKSAWSAAGYDMSLGFRNLRGSECAHHCQQTLQANIYGPEHNIADLEYFLTDAGHAALAAVEAKFTATGQRRTSTPMEVELDAYSFTEQVKHNLTPSSVPDLSSDPAGPPQRAAQTPGQASSGPPHKKRKPTQGERQQNLKCGPARTSKSSAKPMPKGWDKFQAMVETLLSDPLRFFASKAACSHTGHSKCEIPFMIDALRNVMGRTPAQITFIAILYVFCCV